MLSYRLRGIACCGGGRKTVGSYLVRRFGLMLLTLFGISVIIFLMLRLAPGNIADILFDAAGFVDPTEKAQIMKDLGLDKSLPVQYASWIAGLAQGDLGFSYVTDRPAIREILPRIPITAKLAGLNYVDAGQKADPAFVGPNLKNLPLMVSEDLATNIAATKVFLHGCFSRQPTPDEFETMLAFNMMVPPKVRIGLSNRPLDIDDILRNLKLPVLVTHGAEDKNSNLIAAEYTAKMIPGAKLSIYQGVGHSPFFEATPRFNAELAAFMRSAQKGN